MATTTAASKTRWMIYGANGYTGRIAARLPRPEGMGAPILAGRNLTAIKSLAESLKLEYRIFDLSAPADVDKALEDVGVVVLAAGPFVHTSEPLVDACLRTKTHYLDITGEYEVFEAIHQRTKEAKAAGVVLLPGIGLDVVPTDCLAARLHEELPSATHLQMVLMPESAALSPGTTKTVLNSIGKPTQARRNGSICNTGRSPTATLEWTLPTGEKSLSMPVSWGDISTAFHSTGISNIELYLKTDAKSAAARNGWGFAALRYVASWSAGKWVLNKLVERYVPGPTPEQNLDGRFQFQGIAWNAETKEAVELSATSAEGYQFTAMSMIGGAHKLLTSHKLANGSHTPSSLFGADYFLEFEHSSWGVVNKRVLSEEEFNARKF